MKLVYDHQDEMVLFGMNQIKKSLEVKGQFFVEQYNGKGSVLMPERGIIVQKLRIQKGESPGEEQAFRLSRQGELIRIEGIDSRGLMYGCLEYAERLARGAELADGEEMYRKPAMRLRGIKFNLPYAPFDSGDPFVLNEGTCMDIGFWKAYIDMLALNRYNCLSLWSEHPYDRMVVSPKFRDANPYSDSEINQNIRFFREMFRYAASRGIDIYLFTWNIRITPEVARGLGLPEAVGDFGNMYDNLIHRVGYPLNRFRGASELIRDYIREMVLQLLLTYPELKGLGTSASEWMDGNGYEREKWIVETYVEAIKQSGRDIPFIHRTNMQNAGKEIKEMVQSQFDSNQFYISWKYSNAHCYSHPEPQFERLWDAWEGIDLEKTNILYTVRNDDVFTHRWGDPDYVRAYVKGMIKPHVKGFYWGADGYLWGNDFQHVEHGHKTWKYDFERHIFQFQLWGRLSYDPETSDDVWVHLLKPLYGPVHAPLFLEGLRSASSVIPAVNRLFWIDYDFQWHAESCLSEVSGFKTILDFVNAVPMPGVGVMSISEYAKAEREDSAERLFGEYRETPADILNLLQEAADQTERVAIKLSNELGELCCSHAACTLHDLFAYVEMSRYYACKFKASLALNRFRLSEHTEHKAEAVTQLEQAAIHWEKLGYYWSLHNKPYFMARVKRTFGYPYYLEDVRADIELARRFEK
ncbi:hypothetical protein HZF08_10640 [Paenibacillus sp. CGMCC 1.16610]|uniref:Beta-hexosaminidase bacterial type N-terminal domain-containing protein n=1 Tax=Paenibacillus anseongense TaxID=2682845 RepID=A0ABW9U5L5_9BACL|nr:MULTISPECIES: hypothetical protein [Paenibacillus]MBA2938763.1 hypothetical protein [Paenibacillus sp. CGMCC 1.16610]MVQ34726.1 hypothetical protein [Paenibacillus anseongense]